MNMRCSIGHFGLSAVVQVHVLMRPLSVHARLAAGLGWWEIPVEEDPSRLVRQDRTYELGVFEDQIRAPRP